MLTARKTGFWRDDYEISADGRALTTWSGSFWRGGGEFTLDGRTYRVGGNTWGNKYTMFGPGGATFASADRVGRKRWTVEADGRVYRFRRASLWTSEQELHDDAGRRGSVKRVNFWGTEVAADLPGLPPPVQIFVLGVVLAAWKAEQSAAA